jgi:Methyltransferase domain
LPGTWSGRCWRVVNSGCLKKWAVAPLLLLAAVSVSFGARSQSLAPAHKAFTPKLNQEGKDVVWVPTPHALVDTMLDMAKITPNDYLIDLGSGDGRIVIAAAKRGARALGIELNPDLVELSRRNAEKEGVAGKASFVQADIFETDFSQASVVTIYLLPQLNVQLRPRMLALRPGTRIASNSFSMEDWRPDQTGSAISVKSFFAPALRRLGDAVPRPVLDYFTDYCTFFCKAHMWVVPAKVAGVWQWPQAELVLQQKFQRVEGTLKSGDRSVPVVDGRVSGDLISFSADGVRYNARISGGRMQGAVNVNGKLASWSAALTHSYHR